MHSLRLAMLSLVLLSAGVLGAPHPAWALSWHDWFALSGENGQVWQAADVPGDALRVVLKRRDPSSAEGEPKHVYVLFPKKSSAYNTAMGKILEVFQDKRIPVEFTLVNYEGAAPAGQAAVAELEQGGFDLIFSMGSVSTELAHEQLRHGQTPVVSICSKDPVLMGMMSDYESGSGSNMAYTSLNVPVPVQMAYLRELKPNIKNIAVMYARQNTSAVITQVEPVRELAEAQGIRVLDVVVENADTARAELTEKVPQAVAAMRENDPEAADSVFWITGSTEVFREIATINKHSWNVPVLSVVPDIVREGEDSAVLSIGVSFESNGYLAALYGARIITGGAQAGELRVGVVSPPDLALNFAVARRIGLKVPFSFFEAASFIYDNNGAPVIRNGLRVAQQ